MRGKINAVAANNGENETDSIMKMFQLTDINFKGDYGKRQDYFCSFCKRAQPDDSITFKGVAACPNCIWKWATLSENVRRYEDNQNRWNIVRLYRCYFCDVRFTLRKMSTCLMICTRCLSPKSKTGTKTEARLVEQRLLKIADYIRRRL